MTGRSPLLSLADRFCYSLVQVLTSLSGREYTAEVSAALPSPFAGEWSGFAVTGAVSGTISIGVTPDAAIRLGREVLEGAGVEADDSSARSTFSESLSQTLSAWGQDPDGSLGGPLVVAAGQSIVEPQGGDRFLIQINSSTDTPSEFLLHLSHQFADGPAHAPRSPAMEPAASASAEVPVGSSQTLELLMDVELPVSVSFGRAQLPIKEVLKLSSGSIIELSRSVSEPVELIVNNCVIARGEVVVIEGNYGVRIDEIISPQERLRTLK